MERPEAGVDALLVVISVSFDRLRDVAIYDQPVGASPRNDDQTSICIQIPAEQHGLIDGSCHDVTVRPGTEHVDRICGVTGRTPHARLCLGGSATR